MNQVVWRRFVKASASNKGLIQIIQPSNCFIGAPCKVRSHGLLPIINVVLALTDVVHQVAEFGYFVAHHAVNGCASCKETCITVS